MIFNGVIRHRWPQVWFTYHGSCSGSKDIRHKSRDEDFVFVVGGEGCCLNQSVSEYMYVRDGKVRNRNAFISHTRYWILAEQCTNTQAASWMSGKDRVVISRCATEDSL